MAGSDIFRYILGALAGGSDAAFGEWQRQQALKRDAADKAEARRIRDRDFDLRKAQADEDSAFKRVGLHMGMSADTDLSPEAEADFTRFGLTPRREASVSPDAGTTPMLASPLKHVSRTPSLSFSQPA